jgi:hypothetical protein
MKKSKRDLAKTQAQYEMFKKYKARTAISKLIFAVNNDHKTPYGLNEYVYELPNKP